MLGFAGEVASEDMLIGIKGLGEGEQAYRITVDRAGGPRAIIQTDSFWKTDMRGAAAEKVVAVNSESELATPLERRISEDVLKAVKSTDKSYAHSTFRLFRLK